jgi:cholesterol transport system auxiliary component
MSGRALSVVATVLCLVFLSGCLSRSYPEKQRFILEPQRESLPPVGAAPESSAAAETLRVDRVRVDPLFERKGFVYRVSEETLTSDFYNEFFGPPGTVIRKSIARWLSESTLFGNVLDPSTPGEADWLLEGDVTLLYADLRSESKPKAVLEIQFSLLDVAPSYEVVFEKRYSVTTDAESTTARAITNAWSKSLAEILSGLEADLGNHLRK